MIPRSFLTLCLCLGLGAIPGCSALTAVSGAAESLDIYTLTPARPAPVRSNGRHVVVTPATASGALMTDRILVKPNRLQAEYLPGGGGPTRPRSSCSPWSWPRCRTAALSAWSGGMTPG